MRAFEEACGLGRGNISNMSQDGSLGSDKLSKIIDAYPEIDIHWLLTGIRSLEKQESVSNVDSSNQTDMLERMLQLAEENGRLKAKVEQLEQELSEARDFPPTKTGHTQRYAPVQIETAP